MKTKICSLALLMGLVASAADVDIYSAKDIQTMAGALAAKREGFSSRNLAKAGNHYFMLAHREATGSSELHEHEADVFVVESGQAVIVTGGKLAGAHTTAAGEIRGTSIEGGERHTLMTGDIIHIPAGTPHQLLLTKGTAFTYFVVKVTGQ